MSLQLFDRVIEKFALLHLLQGFQLTVRLYFSPPLTDKSLNLQETGEKTFLSSNINSLY